MKAKKYFNRAIKYAEEVTSGKKIAGADIINACKGYRRT